MVVHMVRLVIALVTLATAVWVATDSSRLGARKGALGGGFLDMGPVGWFFACWLLWIVGFPCYLVARPRLVAAKRARDAAPYGGGWGYGSATPGPVWPAPPNGPGWTYPGTGHPAAPYYPAGYGPAPYQPAGYPPYAQYPAGAYQAAPQHPPHMPFAVGGDPSAFAPPSAAAPTLPPPPPPPPPSAPPYPGGQGETPPG